MKGVITGKVVDWENGEKMEKLSEVGFPKFYSNSVGIQYEPNMIERQMKNSH